MKLKYNRPVLSEGGAAVPGVGTIHISEIAPTLTNLSDELEFPFDLNDFVVGSANKSEYSGDIDVVIDKAWYDGSVEEMYQDLKSIFGSEDIARHGSQLHIKYPIKNFNSTYAERLPRTGFVQVDFIFGNLEWEKFYHYSPGSASGYKGLHRNIAISAITYATCIIIDNKVDGYNRPVSIEKWKWSPKGLLRVIRSSKQRENGSWLKTQTDTIIDGPYKDPEFIARTIFPKDGTPDDMHSLENIIQAVKRNYSKKIQHSIFKRMAESFSENTDALCFSYPTEIEQYFNTDDK